MLRKRVTAIRVSIADIKNGTFSRDNSPHVISPDGVRLQRVAIVGYVSEEPFHKDGFSSITLDDNTEKIRVKAWKTDTEHLREASHGAMVRVVGKIKEYNEEVYLVPEIVQEIQDPHYLELHLLQRYHTLLRMTGKEPKGAKKAGKSSKREEEKSKKPDNNEPLADQILEFIQLHASSSGVSIRDIAEYFKSHGHATAEIHLEVIKLQEAEKIKEVQIGVYTASPSSKHKEQIIGAT